MLRAYSKELYVYTLDLLNAVRIDNAQKGAGGKAYLLKRTISDIGVPLKGQVQGAKGTSNAHTSNGKSNGKSSKEALATAGVDAPS
ncbi:hypothetical protein EW145_g7689 [Phellinidium pouzarii]|uniref:Uncharacterized protein n=1 Tax=Phellinidium pouzarii TaxID=167371 RepID=A0A4S4KFI4_9AGAM|nr:hypothetical protein EW145_g7689 [Phellinidium pouzarii]